MPIVTGNHELSAEQKTKLDDYFKEYVGDLQKCWEAEDWMGVALLVFGIDVLQCPRCSCRMQRIAFLTQPRVIRRFLDAIAKRDEPP